MYNGIGLVTPRGSGTSGYVTRNLSALRPRDDFRASADRDMPVKHRAPDASILDHERKRKIEVQCLELQDELEEKGVSPDEIEERVNELRQRLQRQGAGSNAQPERGSIKEYQRHEILAAKAVDNDRFSRALGIRPDFVEGESINRERQQEIRMQRQMDKERRNEEIAQRKRQHDEHQEQRNADRAQELEKQRLEVQARAREREDRFKEIQRERDLGRSSNTRLRNDMADSYRPDRNSRRSRSPSPRRSRRDSRSRSLSRSASPPRRRRASSPLSSRSRSRSASPREFRIRGRARERSYSASPRRSRSRTRSRSHSRSQSPPRRRREALSPSPPRRARDASPPSRARRTSPPQKKNSPPPDRQRAPSEAGSEDMDVSDEE